MSSDCSVEVVTMEERDSLWRVELLGEMQIGGWGCRWAEGQRGRFCKSETNPGKTCVVDLKECMKSVLSEPKELLVVS